MLDHAASGLSGIIAVHSTALGPALGGCRVISGEAIDIAAEAIRLARTASYAHALAGLPWGGAQTVLHMAAPEQDRDARMRALASAVSHFEGGYVATPGVGMLPGDMAELRHHTPFVAAASTDPRKRQPAYWTALGVFQAMRMAAQRHMSAGLRGLAVAVQGLDETGETLARMLREAGARLTLCDPDETRALALAQDLNGTAIDMAQFLTADVDILAPCMGSGMITESVVPRIRAKLICGAAEDQLAEEDAGWALLRHGIAYAPDYVVNCGGTIALSAEHLGETQEQVRHRIGLIPARLVSVLEAASEQRRPSALVADEMARAVMTTARRKAA
jgi:leucine dehydrogenase